MTRPNIIKAIRQAQQLTQQECAKRYGCAQPAWCEMETHGPDRMGVGRLRKVARVLGVDPSELLGSR